MYRYTDVGDENVMSGTHNIFRTISIVWYMAIVSLLGREGLPPLGFVRTDLYHSMATLNLSSPTMVQLRCFTEMLWTYT